MFRNDGFRVMHVYRRSAEEEDSGREGQESEEEMDKGGERIE
jgi:hypothetical protein